jgi:hypothetical protein
LRSRAAQRLGYFLEELYDTIGVFNFTDERMFYDFGTFPGSAHARKDRCGCGGLMQEYRWCRHAPGCRPGILGMEVRPGLMESQLLGHLVGHLQCR